VHIFLDIGIIGNAEDIGGIIDEIIRDGVQEVLGG